MPVSLAQVYSLHLINVLPFIQVGIPCYILYNMKGGDSVYEQHA